MVQLGLLINDIPKYIFFILWLGINAFLFTYFYIYYEGKKFYYTRILLGPGLPLARAPASCLNFNCMLILLPVCRNLLSLIRGSAGCCPRRLRRLLDKNITFHRTVAYMIVLMTLIHYFAHSFNVEYYSGAWNIVIPNGGDPTKELKQKLIQLGAGSGESYLDPFRRYIFPLGGVFVLTGGWTGVIIMVALFIMVTSSTEFLRRSYFEVFWFTHHLFIVFFGFLVVHGIGSQVRGQTDNSLKEHDPIYCSVNKTYKDWGNILECPIPQFGGSAPGTWKWVIGPIIIYAIERAIRFYRFLQPVEILKVIKHPSRVFEIQMRKKGFNAEVGQYIFLHCPSISHLEWHPFTLTSAPEENYLSVHIRIVGDWTGSLAKVIDNDSATVQPSWKMPRIAVDGPFGTASEDVFTYDIAVCVGSGIGVTPFASLLKSVWYKNENETNTQHRLKKVYFYWICPDMHAFEWFGDMLIHLEEQLIQKGKQDLIEYNIYLTRGWSANQAKTIFVHEEDERDVITGLEQKTNYGRPSWDDIFAKIGQQHPNTHVGVFFCGVAALSKTLHQKCNKHSTNGVWFHYNKENF